jgi:hypothetical protein
VNDLKAIKEKPLFLKDADHAHQIISELIDIIEIQRDALNDYKNGHVAGAGSAIKAITKTDKMLGELING